MLAAIVLLALIAASAYQYFSRPASGDKPLPFELATLDGEKVSLDSLLGKPVIIHFWATWCDACVAEVPLFNRVYEKYEASGLKILGISEDEDEAALRLFVKSYQIEFPILPDIDSQVADSYKSYGVPTTIAIGKDGLIAWRLDGPADWDSSEINAKIAEMIR